MASSYSTYTPRRRRQAGARSAWLLPLAVAATLTLLASCPAYAEHVPGTDRPWYDVNVGHELLSGEVESMARTLDAFFGGERTYEESTGSYMKISGGTIWSEGGNFDYKYAVRLKLTLPNTRKRFKLVLDSNPDEEDEPTGGDALSDNKEALDQATDLNTYQLALRYMMKATQTVQLTADAGVRLRWPPDPFVRLRARRSFFVGAWELRAIEKLEYSVDDHFESTTTLEFDRPLGSGLLYRNYATAHFGSKDDKFALGAGVILFQNLSTRDALTYKVGVRGESHPVMRTTALDAGVTYRRRLYNKWLFGSLTPEVTWPREDGFSPLASITLKIEMIFGDRALGSIN